MGRGRWYLAGLGLAAAICAAVAPTSGVQRQAPGPTSLFFDDFSSGQLDRSKWNVIVTGRTVNNEQQAYVDSTETIRVVRGGEAGGAENGALLIQPRYRPGFTTPERRKFDFISGRIDTKGRAASNPVWVSLTPKALMMVGKKKATP